MTYLKPILMLTLLSLTACAGLSRSTDSGYAEPSAKAFTKTQRSSHTENRAYSNRSDLSEKVQLKQLENSLSTRKEFEQYSKALPWFKSENERIEFLRIRSFEDRQSWLDSHQFAQRSKTVQQNFQDLIEAQDIAIGMPQHLVRRSWGNPDGVDVSGNPALKNERWRYSRYISSPDGYRPEHRIVYFEGGQVIGWEIE